MKRMKLRMMDLPCGLHQASLLEEVQEEIQRARDDNVPPPRGSISGGHLTPKGWNQMSWKNNWFNWLIIGSVVIF